MKDINEALSRPLSNPSQPGRLNEGAIKAIKVQYSTFFGRAGQCRNQRGRPHPAAML